MHGRRLVFPEIRRVQWEAFDIPDKPGPHFVVAEALCSLISVGTELALYTGTHIGFTLPNPPFPMMPQRPGYAWVGRVTAVGTEVEGIHPGQRVMMEAPHGTVAAVDVRRATVIPLPDALGEIEGTLIRMAGIALTAVRVAPIPLGEAVAVYGLGLVGLLAGQLFRLGGARPVIGIDRIPSRLAVAESHGITALNADQQDIPARVKELTVGYGPGVAVEATGSPAVVPLALELVAKGGRVVLLGSTRGRTELDVYSLIHRKGVTILGGHESVQDLDMVPNARWPKARNMELLAGLLASGDLHTEGLITHAIFPDDALDIYDALAANPQDYLGVVIDWRGDHVCD
jgi:2-desacetyl-2-hydroxyethyl bacteriochlorophyllide A dehydrogenase